MKARTAGPVIGWLTLLAVLLLPAAAQADRAFSLRYGTNTQGDIAVAANTSLSCVSSEGVCPGARDATLPNLTQANNNARVMTYVDSDGDDATFNSSEADLVLPPGARVLFAGLYYGGRLAKGTGGAPAPNLAAAGTALIQAPGATDYTALPAVGIDTAGETYQAFHDVTDIVSAAGAGPYRVANVQAGTGKSDGQLAGWSLVVAYGDPAARSRSLSVFDGLQQVGSGSAGVTIPLSGFRTPATGPVNSTVGIVAYEGDLGTTGDGATIQGASAAIPLGSATPGTPPLNARNNLFDSSISAGGASVAARAPAYRNQLGFDADLFALPGVLGNNQTSTQIRLTTAGDAYQPGVVTIATDLFAPRIVTTKTVDQADADSGDTLTYTLTVQNQGEDGAQGVVLSDAIPDATSYVPGSLTVNGAAQSDAADDDVGQVAGGAVTVNLGTGANGVAGGALAPGSGLQTITFQVRIDPAAPPSTVVRNVGRVDFTAQTTGDADAVDTTPAETAIRTPQVNLVVTKDVISVPDPTKSPNSAYGPEDPIAYRVTVTNQGSVAAPNVVVTDELPPAMRYLGAFIEPGTFCGPTPTNPPTAPVTPPACDVGTLAPGASVAVVFGGDLPGSVDTYPSAQTLTNRVVATSGGIETNPDDNAATAAIDTLPINDVYVSKFVAPAEPLEGGRVIYTILLGSRGPDVSDVSFAELLPAGIDFDPTITIARDASEPQDNVGACEFGEIPEAPGLTLGLCTIPRMEVGGLRTITLTGTVQAGTDGQTITNIAAATPTGLEDSRTFVDNRAEASFVARRVDLALTKTRLETGPLEVGAETTFRLTVANTGSGTAQDAIVTDTMPAGLTPLGTPPECTLTGQVVTCDAGDLAPGAEATFDVRARAGASAAGTTVANVARASSASPDLAPGNDTAQAPVPIAPLPGGEPPQPPEPPTTPQQTDVALRVIAPTATVRAGKPSRWQIEVTNLSQVAASGVTVDGSASGTAARAAQAGCGPAPPAGCAIGTLAPGATRTLDVTLTPARTGTLTLAGRVRTADPETRADNNADQASVDVAAGPTTVTTRVTTPSHRPAAGGTTPIRVTVRNRGGRAARDVAVCVRLPGGLGVARRGGATLRRGRLCWRIDTLPAGARRTFRVTAQVACVTGRRTVRATVRGDNFRTRTARVRLSVACATRPPVFTG